LADRVDIHRISYGKEKEGKKKEMGWIGEMGIF
jgi:hypothetical protein